MTDGLDLWIRSEWRRRWRGLLGVALLIALGGGITIAAIAGARRADSATDRFLEQAGSRITVTASPEFAIGTELGMWDTIPAQIAAVPGVRGVLPVSWEGIALQSGGEPGFFFMGLNGTGVGDDPPTGLTVIEGRLAADAADDEIALNEEAVRFTGASVGDTIELRSYSRDQMAEFGSGNGAEDLGPRVEAEVVGIVRGPEDLADNPEPQAFLSTGFRTTYSDQIAACDCAVFVNAATEDVDEVTARLTALLADQPVTVENLDGVIQDRVGRAVGLEVGALWIAAAIAGLAAVLTGTQAIARFLGSSGGSVAALRALGATRSNLVRAWTVILAPAAVLGAVGAAGLAIAFSPVFPRGLARQAEVDPGIRVDDTAVGFGALVVGILTVLAAAAIGAIATRRLSSSSTSEGGASKWVSRGRPTMALGVSLALNPGGDRSKLAGATAVIGLSLAISGALAVVVIDRSATDLLATPSAFGADWDLEILEAPDDPDAVMQGTLAEPVDALAFQMIVTGTDFTVTGPTGTGLVQPLAFDQVVGATGPAVNEGRPAGTAEDTVLGDSFAEQIGANVGDDILVEPGGQTYRVAGIGRLSDGDETDDFMMVTMDGLGRLVREDSSIDLAGALVRVGGADAAARQRLIDLGWQPVTPPSKVSNLAEIGSVPRLLAIALAALGLAGALHALLVAVSRRRRDIAIARALGFTPRQARTAVCWQGAATTGAAILVGIPLGILIGRVVWKRVTTGVGAVDLVSVPWLAFAAIPVIVLAAVTSAAAIIGRKAARMQPAVVLRSE